MYYFSIHTIFRRSIVCLIIINFVIATFPALKAFNHHRASFNLYFPISHGTASTTATGFIDYGVYDWMNFKELFEELLPMAEYHTCVDGEWKTFWFGKENFTNALKRTTIIVIDDGWSYEIWKAIYDAFGETAAKQIEYVVLYYDVGDMQFTYKIIGWHQYTNDEFINLKIRGGIEDQIREKSPSVLAYSDRGHCATIGWLIKSMLPEVRLIVIRIDGFYRVYEEDLYKLVTADEEILKIWNQTVIKSFNELMPHGFLGDHLFSIRKINNIIFSLSFGFNISYLEYKIKKLCKEYNVPQKADIIIEMMHDQLRALKDFIISWTMLNYEINCPNVFFCISAGNNNTEITKDLFPQNMSLSDPAIITVGAIYDYDTEEGYKQGQKCSFSNYGDSLKACAPGYKILVKIHEYGKTITSDAEVDGTSYSAPLVACSLACHLATRLAYYEYFKIIGKVGNYNSFFRRFNINSYMHNFIYRAFENDEDKTDLTPKPSKYDYLDEPIWDRWNGYGCPDAFDLVLLFQETLREYFWDNYTIDVPLLLYSTSPSETGGGTGSAGGTSPNERPVFTIL